MRAFDQRVVGDAARVQTGAAAADVAAVTAYRAGHLVQVVITLRYLLPRHGTADCVAQQEDPHVDAVAAGQGAGEPQAVP